MRQEPLTWASRHQLVRSALAGMEETTPMELYLLLGGNFDLATPQLLAEAARDLRSHGYRRRMIPTRLIGPLEERWVRDEHWPEDDQWPA